MQEVPQFRTEQSQTQASGQASDTSQTFKAFSGGRLFANIKEIASGRLYSLKEKVKTIANSFFKEIQERFPFFETIPSENIPLPRHPSLNSCQTIKFLHYNLLP